MTAREKQYSPKIAAKRKAKRKELVEGALNSMAERGYAETGLRQIASDLGVSLGVLHYHFENKNDLLIECARHYVDRFAQNMMAVIHVSEGKIITALIDLITDEVQQHYKIHRLWFDISAQSLYVPELRPVVREFEETFIYLARALIQMNGASKVNPAELYVLFERVMLCAVRDCIEEHPQVQERLIEGLLELHLKMTGERLQIEDFLEAPAQKAKAV